MTPRTRPQDLRRTAATTFEELFAAVVKVIEDLKRKTLARDDAEKLRRKPQSKQLTPGLAPPPVAKQIGSCVHA
jgi:hypothetical protein